MIADHIDLYFCVINGFFPPFSHFIATITLYNVSLTQVSLIIKLFPYLTGFPPVTPVIIFSKVTYFFSDYII